MKKYKTRTVVNHVSINVKQGEIVGLLGPNGAGKTTTFYMTVGLVTPNEGKIFLNDKDVLQIIDMLKNTKLQQKEIADIFGVKRSTVYRINTGTSYRMDNIEYPIRK